MKSDDGFAVRVTILGVADIPPISESEGCGALVCDVDETVVVEVLGWWREEFGIVC